MTYLGWGVWTPDTELAHHGIKGMKWGIRRYQNPDGSLTTAGKSRYLEYSNNSNLTDDFVLKKNTSTYRVGGINETDGHRRTYISYTNNDRLNYITYAESLGATHLMTLKTTNNIKVAGGKKQAEVIMQMLGEKKIDDIVKQQIGPANTRMAKRNQRETKRIYANRFKNKESFEKAMQTFSMHLMSDNAITSDYFDRLSKSGYNAAFDINDSKAAEAPIIVFDRQGSLKTTAKTEITTSMVDTALKHIMR